MDSRLASRLTQNAKLRRKKYQQLPPSQKRRNTTRHAFTMVHCQKVFLATLFLAWSLGLSLVSSSLLLHRQGYSPSFNGVLCTATSSSSSSPSTVAATAVSFFFYKCCIVTVKADRTQEFANLCKIPQSKSIQGVSLFGYCARGGKEPSDSP